MTVPIILPEGTEEIAHGAGWLVYGYKGHIYLRDQSGADIVFTRSDWDLFSSVIALADLRIRAVVE
jgi:hypothetical protein